MRSKIPLKNIMANSDEVMEDAPSKLAPATVMSIAKSTAAELKSRLNRDKPALTLVDVRDSKTFNREHIPGAISVPFARLEDLSRSALMRYRDIYIYGESDEQALQAAQILLSTGFLNVAQIIGGLTTWRELSRATETHRSISSG
jgi:rhodanese-related sulfurtransferase